MKRYCILQLLIVVVQSPRHVWLPVTPQTAAHQVSLFLISPGVCPSSCPLNQCCHPSISSSVALFFCFQSFPALESFQWVGCLHQVTKVLELQLQYQSFQSVFRVVSPCYSLELCIKLSIPFPFSLAFLLIFIPQLFVKPPQIPTLPSCIPFSLGWFCSLLLVQYYKPLFIVLQGLCLPDLVPWIYLPPPLYK